MNSVFRFFDRIFDRLYSSRWNPLQFSGALALFFLIVCTVSGIFLLFFFRVSEPYESVRQMQDSILLNGLRSGHRYASDLALVVVGFHLLRMLVEKRYWGPRILAWVSGSVLLGMLMVVGWTGFILVWDQQALALTAVIAKAFHVERVVSGATPPGGSFFFLNLFFHMSIPLLMIFALLIHVSKMRKPVLFLPRKIGASLFVVILGISILLPAPLGEKANFLTIDHHDPINWIYGFPIPLADRFGAFATVSGIVLSLGLLMLIPWLLPHIAFRRVPVPVPENRWLSVPGWFFTTLCFVLLAMGGQGLYARTHDNAVLRLSLRIPHRHPDGCRAIASPDDEKIPFHMRPQRRCQTEARFLLKLFSENNLLWQTQLAKAGDRPFVIEKEFPLSPGEHNLSAVLQMLDDNDAPPVEIQFQSRLEKGEVGLISFDATKFKFIYAESN